MGDMDETQVWESEGGAVARREVTLFIDTWSSECGACGGGADPYEKSHKTRLGYNSQGEGCGAVFTRLSSHYNMQDLHEVIKGMRPDLPFNPNILFDKES